MGYWIRFGRRMRGACEECGTLLVHGTRTRRYDQPTDAHFGPASITVEETLPHSWCPVCDPEEAAPSPPPPDEPLSELERAIIKARGGYPSVKRRTI